MSVCADATEMGPTDGQMSRPPTSGPSGPCAGPCPLLQPWPLPLPWLLPPLPLPFWACVLTWPPSSALDGPAARTWAPGRCLGAHTASHVGRPEPVVFAQLPSVSPRCAHHEPITRHLQSSNSKIDYKEFQHSQQGSNQAPSPSETPDFHPGSSTRQQPAECSGRGGRAERNPCGPLCLAMNVQRPGQGSRWSEEQKDASGTGGQQEFPVSRRAGTEKTPTPHVASG